MKVPTAESCCCICSLRTGTILIGLITLIGAVCGLFRTARVYYETLAVGENTDLDDPDMVVIREHLLAHQVMICGYMVSSLISAILSSVLLGGVYMENRTMVRTWVFGSLALQIFSIFGSVGYCIVLGNFYYMVVHTFICLNLYCMWVVYSYAREMTKSSSNFA